MAKYYVVYDKEDPGSEHDTWEEAAEVVKEAHKKGFHEARILHAGWATQEQQDFDDGFGYP